MLKTGIDLVYIPRMQKLIENKEFIAKTFHSSETKPFTAEHLAGIFAAKEALFKAVNTNLSWLDIEIIKEKGKPRIKLSSEIKKKLPSAIELSISHEHEYAIAHVVVLQNGNAKRTH